MNRASTVYSANPKRSEGSGRELGTHKRSCPDLKHRATGCNVWPGPERSEGPASGVLPLCTARTRSAVRVPAANWALIKRPHKAPSEGIGRELGTHKRSCPDLKHSPTAGVSSPDLNEVRVQHEPCFHCVQREPETW